MVGKVEEVLPLQWLQALTIPNASMLAAPAISRSIDDPEPIPDEPAADAARAEVVDRLMHAWQGRFTASLSPAALIVAFYDWGVHLANAPGKQSLLVEKAARKWVRLALYLSRAMREPDCPPCIEPLPQDRRFADEAW